MFTGIITDIGTITAIDDGRVEIACHYDHAGIALGASIACDGCCLTVTSCKAADATTAATSHEAGPTRFTVDVSPETKRVTTLDNWQIGQKINLERALKMGDEFGGHIVSGHVDGIATIQAMEAEGNSVRYRLAAPAELARFIAPKGSVTLNGVSLTVNDTSGDEFTVTIIPHTAAETNWQFAKTGSRLNLEVDLLARYALRGAEYAKQQLSTNQPG